VLIPHVSTQEQHTLLHCGFFVIDMCGGISW
jgi:hypothetical protein